MGQLDVFPSHFLPFFFSANERDCVTRVTPEPPTRSVKYVRLCKHTLRTQESLITSNVGYHHALHIQVFSPWKSFTTRDFIGCLFRLLLRCEKKKNSLEKEGRALRVDVRGADKRHTCLRYYLLQPYRVSGCRGFSSITSRKSLIVQPVSFLRFPYTHDFFLFSFSITWRCAAVNWGKTTAGASAVSWEDWWTYEGISGPAFWGLINPEWSMCNRGRRQSPINIEPSQLLFDPNLRPLHIDKNTVAGYLSNMGQGLIFTVDNSSKPSINLTGGPLSYKYEWHQMALHFGLNNQSGSEHTIAGRAFPAELQVFGFNTQLYSTYSEALESPHGIVAISVLIQVHHKLYYFDCW
ncbi:putative Carbonic anhydrase-related protein [Daphnia magna]|uniref:Putative Carbonic anhydrase-related protein n=1 Tax=Daphnia magna TaxID=35525 RepID=A0A162QVV6_9CRUS|nr:putative Carbonic anhydrase-related protein [Daphnia magna]